MNRTVLFLTFILLTLASHAQFEAKQWFFGDGAGIDFKTGSASAFNQYQMNSVFGSTVMSDCNGELLFYSNGQRIYNKYNQSLNNDTISGSSSLPVLAVPVPNSNKQYYLFYMKHQGDTTVLKYALLDMSNAAGIIITKNVLLEYLTCNKIAAVHHENNNDFWLLTHPYRSNQFNAYAITSSGISTSPVTSFAGPVINKSDDRDGAMSFSADGRILVNAFNSGHIGIYNFDRSTGSVWMKMDLTNTAIQNPNSAAFSPSANRLYVASRVSSSLYQMDISSGTAASSVASVVQMDQLVSGQLGDIQLGLDGRLYIAIGVSNRLAQINFPDLNFPDCNYQRYGLFLNGNSSNFGLPDFVQTFFNVPAFITSDNHCTGGVINLQLFPECENLSVHWNFDNDIDVLNTDTFSAEVTTSIPGQHIITGTASFNCGTEIFCDTIYIDETPDPDLGSDTTVCPGDYVEVTVSVPGTILWSDGSTESYRKLFAGSHIVNADNNGCIGSDSIIIDNKASQPMMLLAEGILCRNYNNFPELTVMNAITSTWYPEGSSGLHYSAMVPGMFWVVSTNAEGCTQVDSLNIEEDCLDIISLPSSFTPNNDGVNDMFFCRGELVSLAGFMVFNRNGTVVFSTSDVNSGWDGTFNGQSCPQGIYGCLLKYTDEKGKRIERISSIALIR